MPQFREMLREGYSLQRCFHLDAGWEGDQWDAEADEADEQEEYADYDCVDYVKQDDIEKDNECFECCYRHSIHFVQQQYVKKNKTSSKLVFVHVTTATNRDNVEKVFWDVQNMIIRSNLKRGGIV